MTLRALPALLLGALSAVAAPAGAQPSIWERVKHPHAAAEYRALTAAERMRHEAFRGENGSVPIFRREMLHRALGTLEVSGAENHRDVRSRFLLGKLLVEVDDGREEQALPVLERALRQAPDSPLATSAWFDLAIASAKGGNAGRDEEAYTHALGTEWLAPARALMHLNRAETHLFYSRFGAAIADYQAAIDLSSGDLKTHALAQWGLAVARDRDGDLPSALQAVSKAVALLTIPGTSHHIPLGMLGGVFFVPSFDVHYYEGLGALSRIDRADASTLPAEVRDCILEWTAYIADAEPAKSPWVDKARRHRDRCEARQKEVAKKHAGAARRAAPQPKSAPKKLDVP